AEEREHLVPDNLDHLLGRSQAAQDFLIERALANAIDERLDDLEVDVGFEQRHPDFPEARLDRFFRQPSFAANRAEDILEAAAERVEHPNRRLARPIPSCPLAATRHTGANPYPSMGWRRAPTHAGSMGP